jgi:hypothetical protein
VHLASVTEPVHATDNHTAWQRAADARQLERRARMAARASDSHPPGQLDDSRGSMPSLHLTRGVNHRQAKTGDESEVEAGFGKNSCCGHDSSAWDESELAAAFGRRTTEYQLGRQTKAGHGSEVEGNTNFDLMKAVFMQRHK